VIHLALRQLDESDPNMLTRIASVILIADPAKVKNGDETTWEADNTTAGSGVQHASGIWTDLHLPDNGPLPSSVTDQTIAFCHNHDLFCATPLFDLGTAFFPLVILNDYVDHTDYTATELNDEGTSAALHLLGLG
jgi:hypothetical protein